MRSSLTGRADLLPRKAWSFLLFAVCAGPLVAMVAKATKALSSELLIHLCRTVLPMQLGYSLFTATGVVIAGAALAIGGLACGLFEFRGRSLLEKLLLIPLLVPAWFLCIIYREAHDANGVGWLILTLGIASAPLFHLLGTAALRRLPHRYSEVLQVLGRGRPRELVRVLGPLSLPALGVAGALAFLSAWADAPSARIMAVPTLTVGLFDQWFGREQDAAGALISLGLLAVSLIPGLLLWRLTSRATWKDSARLHHHHPARRQPLHGWPTVLVWLLCTPQLVGGVAVPFVVIGTWTVDRLARVNLALLASDLLHSLVVAGGGTLLAVLLGSAILYAQSMGTLPRLTSTTGGIAFAVFALPTAALGMAFLWLLPSGPEPGFVESVNSTPLPLVAALGVRFAAIFFAVGHAALLRHGGDHAALLRVFGRSDVLSFVRCLRPFLTGPMAAAASFVFLQVLQDLPLALLLQPFDYATMSTRLFQYAQTQRVRECAVWILCLAIVGVYPLLTLARAGCAEPEQVAAG